MKNLARFGYDLSRFIHQLELSSSTQDRAEAILIAAEQAGLTSRRTPAGLMAAALYIASILEGERRTQQAIGQVIGVSAATIQTRYRELVHRLDIRSE
jgi:transcription initiation factor TFIIB